MLFSINMFVYVSAHTNNVGTLKGYIYNTHGSTVENAHINISYHDTFKDGYTDRFGYYKIIDIPICKCLKNVTVSKEDYKTITEWLNIEKDTWFNFTIAKSNLMNRGGYSESA